MLSYFHVEVKQQQRRRERKRGERESIQFNNKDVHLNKRINEARNSMKCDAIHRTLSTRNEIFLSTHSLALEQGVLYGVTQHNHRISQPGFPLSQPLIVRETVLRRTTLRRFPKITHTHTAEGS